MTIPIAHDFTCPWCYVGLLQANRLIEEFSVEIEWVGYEMFPVELEWPQRAPMPPEPADKPPIPSRFQFLEYADGVEVPKVVRPMRMRTFNAHQAAEFAKRRDRGFEFVAALYRAYWHEGRTINDIEELLRIGGGFGFPHNELRSAIESKAFANDVVGFDEPAHERGIWNVPTFFVGEKRYAEQPYVVLERAVREALE